MSKRDSAEAVRVACPQSAHRGRSAGHSRRLPWSRLTPGSFKKPGKIRHTAVADMAHDGSMCRSSESPIERIKSGLADLPAWLTRVDDADLGDPLVDVRDLINRLEAVLPEPMRRFEKSGAYKADGALDLVAWLRWKCGLSGGAAAERVGIARQLENLPRTREAFVRGDVGYQQVAAIARTADHIGADAVRRGE